MLEVQLYSSTRKSELVFSKSKVNVQSLMDMLHFVHYPKYHCNCFLLNKAITFRFLIILHPPENASLFKKKSARVVILVKLKVSELTEKTRT